MKTANPRTDLRVVAALFLGLAAAGIASPLTGQPLGGIGVGRSEERRVG